MIRRLAILIPLLVAACSPAPAAPSPTASAGAKASPSSSAAATSASATPSAPVGSAMPTPSATEGSGPFAGYIFVQNATGTPPDGFTRYKGTVVDGTTGEPVAGACVYTGPPAGCPRKGALQTDDEGSFAVDLPSGSQWEFTFEDPDYHALIRARLTPGTDNPIQLVHE